MITRRRASSSRPTCAKADIRTRGEFLYTLRLRSPSGLSQQELTELSKLICDDLVARGGVVRVGGRIYERFVGTPAPEELRLLWERTAV